MTFTKFNEHFPYPVRSHTPIHHPLPLATATTPNVSIYLVWTICANGTLTTAAPLHGFLHLTCFFEVHPCFNMCQQFIPFY